MDEKDSYGFDKNSKLYELFKLLEQAMREQNEDSIESQFIQFNNNPNHTFFPYSELDEKEPDKVEKFQDGNLNYEIKYWYLPEGGHYKSVEITGDESLYSANQLDNHINNIMGSHSGANKFSVDVNRKEEEKSLEELLKDALKVEDYMLAAKIRDEINARKQNMEAKIIEINLALEQGDIEKSERLLDELRRLKK